MELVNDIEFTAEMKLNFILKIREDEYPDCLNYFKEGEHLDTLDSDTLKSKLSKSFGLDLDYLEKLMIDQNWSQELLVKTAHYSIEIANASVSPSGVSAKRPKPSQEAGGKKKQKTTVSTYRISIFLLLIVNQCTVLR